MKTKEFLKYEVPLVEIIEVKVEKGFAISNEGQYIPVTPPGGDNL